MLSLASASFADDKTKNADLADFAGAYSYTASYTMTLTSPQKQTLTQSDEGSLTISPSKKSGFVLTFTAKGETCQITASRSGKTGLKVPAGQTCSMEDADRAADLTFAVTSGSGTLTGESLTMTLAWKLSGTVGGAAISGRATETVQAEQKYSAARSA